MKMAYSGFPVCVSILSANLAERHFCAHSEEHRLKGCHGRLKEACHAESEGSSKGSWGAGYKTPPAQSMEEIAAFAKSTELPLSKHDWSRYTNSLLAFQPLSEMQTKLITNPS